VRRRKYVGRDEDVQTQETATHAIRAMALKKKQSRYSGRNTDKQAAYREAKWMGQQGK
jgi:hypothetical protein